MCFCAFGIFLNFFFFFFFFFCCFLLGFELNHFSISDSINSNYLVMFRVQIVYINSCYLRDPNPTVMDSSF